LNDLKVEGVRIVFPHLFEPWAGPQGTDTPMYQGLFGLPEGQAGLMHQAEERLITEAYPNPAQRPHLQRWIRPVTEKPGLFEADPSIKWFVSAKSKYPPRVYGPDAQIIDSAHDPRVYGGALVVLHATPFIYKQPRLGVSWALHNIQIIGGGPPMGNANPDPGFTAVPAAQGMPAAPAPAAPAAPAAPGSPGQQQQPGQPLTVEQLLGR